MNLTRLAGRAAGAVLALTLGLSAPPAAAAPAKAPGSRNIVIFVADGLRYDSVTPETAPTMLSIKKHGVDFTNTHAMYPSVTTANASAIATGHYLGDTGNYANGLYTDFPVHCHAGDPVDVVFLEDDCILTKMKAHFGHGYLGQTTLIEAARKAGYLTAIVGKKGPAAIQWIGALKSRNDFVTGPRGVFIDQATDHPKNFDGTPTMSTMIHQPMLSAVFKAAGTDKPAFTTVPNWTQQAFMTSVATHVLIPRFRDTGRPFVLLFWSRDPDSTQHGADDSIGRLVPGINSIDAHSAIRNADNDLRAIRAALKKWGLDKNTDIFVTADHGFSTIAKGIPTPDGALPRSTLGRGFVALDVAEWLGNQKVFDPNNQNLEVAVADGERPKEGSALIGPDPKHPKAIVVANGGSDFIYVPAGADKMATTKRIFAELMKQPYVSGVFINDNVMNKDRKAFAGALPMSAVNLMGAGTVPKPDIVFSFRSFVAKGCKLKPLLCTAEIADTGLQTGQGMHGSFSRADMRNFMAAIGPDFKHDFRDHAPISNADIAPTLAHLLKVKLTGPGKLTGRVVHEALKGGQPVRIKTLTVKSAPGADGLQTVVYERRVGKTRYFDAAGFPGRTVGVSAQ